MTLARYRISLRRACGILLCGIPLSGCVLVWGAGYSIDSETPSLVRIKYDSHFASRDEIAKLADTRCARYHRKAVADTETTSGWGLTSATFSCRET